MLEYNESVGRVILSSKESFVPVVNDTSSSETSSFSVRNVNLPLTLNANLPLTPNTTLPPNFNPNLPRTANVISPTSFNGILTIFSHTPLPATLNVTTTRLPDATLPPTPKNTLLPTNSFTRIHTAPTLSIQHHPASPSRAASHISGRTSHPHSRDGWPPSARHLPKISLLDFKADAAAAAASLWKVNNYMKKKVHKQQLAQQAPTFSCLKCFSGYFVSIRDKFFKFFKSPVVRTARPGTAGSSGLYTPAVCGVPSVLKRSRRIVNGTAARPGQWPWMVNVARKDSSGGYTNICGGTLVTDRHVMTAAHCTYESIVTLSIILGGLSRWMNADEIYVTKIMEVRSIRRHDRSSRTVFANDIAIIRLEYPVTFTNYILPICLPEHSTDFLGHQGTILGWGKIHEDTDDFSSTLRQAEIPIQSRETCLEWYHRVGFNPVLRPEFMCAGHEKGGKDACGGDSGGPLMVQDEWRRWVLAGIVSHGYGCAEPYQPGIYINVSFYLPWIHEQLAL